MDSPSRAPRDTSAASGSSSDAEDSAAHIAELVRRTGERNARPGPSSIAVPDRTIAQPVTVPPVAQPAAERVAEPVTQRVAQPFTQRVAQLFTQRVARPFTQRVAQPLTQHMAHAGTRTPGGRPAMRKPPLWALVAGGAVAGVLIATGFALSRPSSPPAAPPAALGRSAPPAFVVRATDVITDCASHSHGRTRRSFETQNCVKATRSLTTGRVSGRPALFVVSRIQMTSAEAAASIKQVLDANGTGNLNDLLREGKTYPGAPDAMPDSGYASVQKGAVILVAEAGFTDGGVSSNTNPALRAAAAQMASR
jgi:hypothetical protein